MNLIYSVAFGHELYFKQAQEMVNSARRNGFLGHITIFTDREYPFTGAFCMVANKAPGDLWKTEIRNLVALETYEKILFVDADIAFIKNPDIIFEMDGFYAAVEKIKLSKHPLNGCYLTDEEKKSVGDKYSFNSGTILMPGKDAHKFLETWNTAFRLQPLEIKSPLWDKTVAASCEMRDQAAFQVLCERSFKDMQELPDGTVYMPGIAELHVDENWEYNAEKCVLIHFNGPLPSQNTKDIILKCQKLCAFDVTEVIKAFRKHTKKLIRDPMAVLLDSVQELAAGIAQLLVKNDALEKRITELEKEHQYA